MEAMTIIDGGTGSRCVFDSDVGWYPKMQEFLHTYWEGGGGNLEENIMMCEGGGYFLNMMVQLENERVEAKKILKKISQ